MNFKKMLEEILDGDDNREVIKTVPVTKEQKKKYQEIIKMGEELTHMEGKLKSTRNAFWSQVEQELDDYRGMRYNRDTDEIEIFATEFDKAKTKGKSVKSPIQIKLD